MRLWLHRWEGNEWGWHAWSLDHLGFATWAPSRPEVLERAQRKLEEHRQWLAEYGVQTPFDESRAEIVEEISGDEVAFRKDLTPASGEEIARCVELLGYTRRGLLSAVEHLSDGMLDWDPPYRHFASYAWWRTIRQILAHVALTEVGYYLPSVGWRAGFDPGGLKGKPWREQLQRSREETLRFLDELIASPDRARVHGSGETWSVRKVLRRLVWHERLHGKSIRRITGAYRESCR